MSKTERTEDGHLLWKGGLANGRPAVKYEGKTVYIKRLVWEQKYGPIPKSAVVISTCGERTCIELTHLALAGPGRTAERRAVVGRIPDSQDVDS